MPNRDSEADARDAEAQREVARAYQAERASEHKHNRRQKTPYDFLRDSGSMAGAVIAIVGLGAWVLDVLPIAKAQDVKAIQQRLSLVEQSLGSINIGQKEMQELQLMDRISVLEDKINKAVPNEVLDLRRQHNEANQKLVQIRAELQAARLGPGR